MCNTSVKTRDKKIYPLRAEEKRERKKERKRRGRAVSQTENENLKI